MAQPNQRVAGETYEQLTGQLFELGRQLRQPNGYPFDPEALKLHLQAAIEGRFNHPTVVVRQASNRDSTPSQKWAQEIMGAHNMRTLADVENLFGVQYSDEDAKSLETVRYSEKTLRECAATHILVPGFALNLLEIRAKATRELTPGKPTFYQYENAWYNNQAFARDEKVAVKWYLVRKDIVPNSTSKNYDEQFKLVTKKHAEDWIPSACELAYGVVLHYLAFGERLLGAIYARTSSVDSGGDRVVLGGFDAEGLGVRGYWGVSRVGDLGLASARKFS